MSSTIQPMLEAPWGAIIGVYFVLVGLATGITLLTLWIHPQDDRARVHYEWVTTWVAFMALAAASILLVIDLGQPSRFYLMITSFSNLASPMSIGAKLIALKLYLLAMYLYLLTRRRGALTAGDVSLTGHATQTLFAVIPAALGLISLALAVYPAILLARTWSSPLAHTAGAGVLFLSTALLMGTAVAIVTVWTGSWLGETRRGSAQDNSSSFLSWVKCRSWDSGSCRWIHIKQRWPPLSPGCCGARRRPSSGRLSLVSGWCCRHSAFPAFPAGGPWPSAAPWQSWWVHQPHAICFSLCHRRL
jgi:Ni/Fe-hydrogenase subunit HybB-like protein